MANLTGNARGMLRTVLILLIAVTWGTGCSNKSSTTDIAASINTAPTIRSVTASPNTITRGGTSRIVVSATDDEGDDLTYNYSCSGGSFEIHGNTATWTAPAAAGKYILTVTISDGRLTTEVSVAITVFVPLTMINGALVLESNRPVDLSQALVALRAGATTFGSDSLVRYIPVSGSGAHVTFEFDDVLPGRYYLEAWQDVDRNGLLSPGDYYGRYGTAAYPGDGPPPLEISEGQTRYIQIQMSAFPGGTGDDGTRDKPGQDYLNLKGEREAIADGCR